MFHVEHQLKNILYCPVCKAKEKEKHLLVVDHNVSNDVFTITKCCKCGFLFTNPIPTKETIGNYYKSNNYISHSGTKKGLINYIYHFVRNYQLFKKERLISNLSNEKTLLDIGCGTGEFLSYCKNKGWNTVGTEPDLQTRERIKNLTIFPGLNSKELRENSFSIVTMWHVLEHVYDLEDDLKTISSLIKKGGYLIVAVPNHESFDAKIYKENWVAYDVPIHLYHFRKKDIKALFSKFNFELSNIKPLIFDAYYISLLSEKKKGGNFILGLLNGLKSNLKAKNKLNHSSLIYILKKL
ncbi:MAG: methyltransferase [Crocinitomicaceae bacterium]|nr:methyltransferase [Crocinitomicaceae bacterium]